ncbi:MAG: type II methionyl aminopeptidase [Candidatus Micrarchaeota archaeon]
MEEIEEKEDLEDYRQAGRITSKIREESKSLIMIGTPLLDIAETIEQMIVEEGLKVAFPVNISINEIAAHYTPEVECQQCLKETDLVKIDIGAHLNGAIADTAYSVDLSDKNQKLIEASEAALEKALQTIKPGITNGEVGGVVEETIKSFGFKPISNLSGHMIRRYDLHAGIDVPSVKTKDNYQFQVGDVFAIEPFATNGAGYVEDSEQVEIFSIYGPNPIRMRHTRQILKHVLDNYGMTPFAERWIRKEFKSKMLVGASLRELLSSQVIRGYPVLKDTGKGIVSQAEHTIIVTEKGCEITTK